MKPDPFFVLLPAVIVTHLAFQIANNTQSFALLLDRSIMYASFAKFQPSAFYPSCLVFYSTFSHHCSFSLCTSFCSFLSVTLFMTFLWSQFQAVIVAVFIFSIVRWSQRHQRLDSQLELTSNRLPFVWLLPLVRRVWKLQELKKMRISPLQKSLSKAKLTLLPGDLF